MNLSDNNFEFVLKMPNTKYRWLMSDTCYIDEVGSILDDLQKTEWDAYILNGGDGTRHLYLPKEKKIYKDSVSLMSDIGWHLTWISCMIYNEWMINSMDFSRYRDSSFNQTALMFDPLANKHCNVCFNAEVRVQNLTAQKDSGWLYHVFDVMYRKWYLLIMSLPIYYPYEVKIKCIRDNAKKAALLQTYFHLLRRGGGKWDVHDVYRNKFFISQSNGGLFSLMIIGIIPRIVIKLLLDTMNLIISPVKKNERVKTVIKRLVVKI